MMRYHFNSADVAPEIVVVILLFIQLRLAVFVNSERRQQNNLWAVPSAWGQRSTNRWWLHEVFTLVPSRQPRADLHKRVGLLGYWGVTWLVHMPWEII